MKSRIFEKPQISCDKFFKTMTDQFQKKNIEKKDQSIQKKICPKNLCQNAQRVKTTFDQSPLL
jgi:hypothetical protein